MKPTFLPQRFAQVLLAASALIFTQCDKPATNTPAGSAATPPTSGSANSIPLISDGASSGFRAVASHLELGGCSYEYTEAGGAAMTAKFLDAAINSLPPSQRKDLPPDFSFAKVVSLLGLDSFVAIGSSSRARADGSFHSRSFAYMPQGRKGLLTLSGGPASKLLLLDVAPKDTDLALEFPVHTKDFARDGMPGLLAFLPASERAQYEKEMSRPIPPLGLTGKQIIEKLEARVGIFLRLDPTQKFQPSPSAPELPGADAVIVIDHLGWLIEALKPQFMPKLSAPGAPFAFTDEGGVLTMRFTSPVGPPPMDYQPVVRFDPKADRLLITTRTALFDSILAGKEKITQGADFTQAWRDLPNEGNICVYASARMLQTTGELITKAAKSPGTSPEDAALIGKIFEWVKPLISRGQAVLIANQADGIFTTGNTSIATGGSTMAAISTVAVLSSLAVPAYAKARSRAVQTNDQNTVRQVQLALKMYAADNGGKYPAALTDLAPKYTAGSDILEFNDHRTGRRLPWLYRNSLTDNSPGEEVLIAAPVETPDGKRTVGLNDGSVRVISESEFQALWSRK